MATTKEKLLIEAYVDGACRGGNPGFCSCAYAIYFNGKLDTFGSRYLGPERKTNNHAEYIALITLLAGSALEADRAGATGLHSSAASLRTLTTRPQVKLWSVAVENAADLSRASALGADLALLSSPLAAALPAPLDLPLYVADDRGQARQLHTSPT